MGLDLPELWRARRYKYLLAIVERLPRDSHYISELADDDELADSMPPGAATPPPPSLTEFGPMVEHLAAVRDILSALLAVQVTAPGKKPQVPKPVPRPVTAAQRAAQRRAEERRAHIVALFKPGGEGL